MSSAMLQPREPKHAPGNYYANLVTRTLASHRSRRSHPLSLSNDRSVSQPLKACSLLKQGMSVYRKFDEGPPSESFVYPAKRQKVAHGPPSPKLSASRDEEAQRRKRKGVPSNELLKPSFRWAATLPRSVQPLALMRRFPRIANQLAAVWSETQSVRSHLDSLLVDGRGNRQGFPPDVLRELLSLRLYHENLHPQNYQPRSAGA